MSNVINSTAAVVIIITLTIIITIILIRILILLTIILTIVIIFIIITESLMPCSGELLMPDGSITPCAIKRVQYITEPQKACVQLELGALQAVLGKASLVQCLGAVETSSRATPGYLTILTECAFFPAS